MATFSECLIIPGFTAGSNYASYQYYIVRLGTTAGTVYLASATTQHPIGVLVNDPASGGVAAVATLGISKCYSESTVNIGDYVASSSTGRAKTTTDGADGTLGIAMDTGSAGELIRVLVIPGHMGD
jgi:hypothetical protein